MKTTAHPILLWFFLSLAPVLRGQVAEGEEMVTLPGDGSVHELTLNTQVVTTVTFPDTITMVTGYGMVLNAAAAQELINSEKMTATMSPDMAVKPVTIVHYAQASPETLALRAVRRGTSCYLTVRCGTAVFLFKLDSGEAANLAVTVEAPGAASAGYGREVQKQDIAKSRIAFSSAELLGVLSKARSREFLQTVNPTLYNGWRERRGLTLDSQNGPLKSTITEVQQWPEKDALVLRARLKNEGEREFHYSPIDTKVRIGDRSYNVQLADGSGIAPAGSTTLLDVVLQGNAGGGREHLSIENDFRLEIAEASGFPPNDLLPPPQPLLPEAERGSRDVPPIVIHQGSQSPPDSTELPLPTYSSGK
ncbi:MAG: hypothetical protein KDK99_09495 [Verrucomicrobiales bacterium]|nr:hypothetical protein [Verrucomicrobiales bacterium]